MCCLFAATYPARTTRARAAGGFARRQQAPDYPFGRIPEACTRRSSTEIARDWGGPVGLDVRAPSRLGDRAFRDSGPATFARRESGRRRRPDAHERRIDIRPILPAIRVPTLVLHRRGDRSISVEAGRISRARIPGARFVELAGDDHLPWVGDADAVLGEIEEFLTGARPRRAHRPRARDGALHRHRRLDAARAALWAIAAWAELLAAHHARVREQLARAGGHEVSTAGDGFLATFDGPARAVRCAVAILEALRPLGHRAPGRRPHGRDRACGDDIRGLAVHIGARVSAPSPGPARSWFAHGPGPRRRLGPRVRGSRHPRPEGRPRRVAAVRCRIGVTNNSRNRQMTFSIVARDPVTRDLGVAVQSQVPGRWLGRSLGSRRRRCNRHPGPRQRSQRARRPGFASKGSSADEVLGELLAADELRAERQLAIVDESGRAATYTGQRCFAWAGGRTGDGFAAQGNILAGPTVVDAMADRFVGGGRPFPDLLVDCLAKADAAGGDRRGRQSAALLVVREGGGFVGGNDRWIDLRVDDHPDPIGELARLVDLHRLLWIAPEPDELLPLDQDLAVELRGLLERLHAAPGANFLGSFARMSPEQEVEDWHPPVAGSPRPMPSGWDEGWQTALSDWMIVNNLDARISPAGWVDSRALAVLRRHGS